MTIREVLEKFNPIKNSENPFDNQNIEYLYYTNLSQAETEIKKIFLEKVEESIKQIKLENYNNWGSKFDEEMRGSLDVCNHLFRDKVGKL